MYDEQRIKNIPLVESYKRKLHFFSSLQNLSRTGLESSENVYNRSSGTKEERSSEFGIQIK